MWKSLVFLLIIVPVLHASKLALESSVRQGYQDVEAIEDDELEQGDAEKLNHNVFSDDLRGSEKSMTTKTIKFVEDEPEDLNEITEDQLSEAAVDLNPVEVKEQEVKATIKKEEVRKPVQRGWRRRRRRRRRRSPPPPPPTLPPIGQCGSVRYNTKTHSCCFNRFIRSKGKCPVFHCTHLRPPKSSVTYNPFTHRCCYGRLKPRTSRCPVYRCGTHTYNPRFLKCCRRGRRYRVYNIHTHSCCHGIPIPKCYRCHPWAVCARRLYSTWLYRCCAGRYIYSLHFQKCCHGNVIDKQALCLRRG